MVPLAPKPVMPMKMPSLPMKLSQPWRIPASIAILTGAELSLIAPGGDPATLIRITATLALLVGAMLLVAWVLRLGFVANFISEPVLVGFKAGIGLVIVLDQVPKLLGVHFAKGSFLHNLLALAQAVGDRRRQDVQQQLLVLPVLLLDHVVLGMDLVDHAVEGDAELADLVARPRRDLDVVVAGREAPDACRQVGKGAGERTRQPRADRDHGGQREAADEEEVVLQVHDRRKGFGGVDLRNDSPLHARNRERAPGGEH